MMESCVTKLHAYSHKKFEGVVLLRKDNVRQDFGSEDDKVVSNGSKYFSGSSLASDLQSPPLFSYHRDRFRSVFTSSEKETLTSKVHCQLTASNNEYIAWHALNFPIKSEIDCLMKFRNEYDPKIRHEKWTSTEEKSLLGAVDSYQERNWCRIADVVKQRTPMQCLRYYQLNFNKDLLCPTEWSVEEDTILVDAAALYGMCSTHSCFCEV